MQVLCVRRNYYSLAKLPQVLVPRAILLSCEQGFAPDMNHYHSMDLGVGTIRAR